MEYIERPDTAQYVPQLFTLGIDASEIFANAAEKFRLLFLPEIFTKLRTKMTG